MRIVQILFVVTLVLQSLFVVANDPVDINTATAEEMAELDNIGLKKAQQIVQFRDQNGSFETLEDLAKVKGIGKATIEKNRDRMIVSQ